MLLSLLCNLLRKGGLKPYALEDKTGRIFDFSCIPIRQYGRLYTQMEYKTFSSRLQVFSKGTRVQGFYAARLILKPVMPLPPSLKSSYSTRGVKNSERREEYRKSRYIIRVCI